MSTAELDARLDLIAPRRHASDGTRKTYKSLRKKKHR
jgi:hypothetical protein